MARDNQLPFSKTMAKVSPRLHTPVATCIIIGLLSAIPFIQFSGPTVIAVGATASIYLSYLLGNFAVMRARMRGWPKTQGAVLAREVGQARQRRRDRVGPGDAAELPDAVVGELGVRSRTPRAPTTCASSRTRRRSRPTSTSTGEQLVDFKIGFLNDIPLIWRCSAGADHRGDLLLRGAAEEAVRGGDGARPTRTSPGIVAGIRVEDRQRRGRPPAAPSRVPCHHLRR